MTQHNESAADALRERGLRLAADAIVTTPRPDIARISTEVPLGKSIDARTWNEEHGNGFLAEESANG